VESGFVSVYYIFVMIVEMERAVLGMNLGRPIVINGRFDV